jgi:uncharacterized paraquat-inducible protein A
MRARQKTVLQFRAHGWQGLQSRFIVMEIAPKAAPDKQPAVLFYCPACAMEVSDPLTCGDCSALICRRCGTPLESSDELGMG